jgi:hypothetical protein
MPFHEYAAYRMLPVRIPACQEEDLNADHPRILWR